MNPFLLRGPLFLLFFIGFTAVVLLVLWRARRWVEAGRAGGRLAMTDPYLIAYLRGGRNEAIRVAVLGLIERGLLEVRDKIELVVTEAGRKIAPGTDLLEAEVLRFFAIRKQAPDAFKLNAAGWESVLDTRRVALENAGLLPNQEARRYRLCLALLGCALLLGVSGLKIALAMSQGRGNIGFLIVLTVLAMTIAITVPFHAKRTPQGDAAIEDMQTLFEGVKHRAHGRPSLDDLIMVAAVFGMSALPAAATPYVAELYPRAASADGGSSGCGSSCGSGGGCGGGCGGCGGCGG